MNPITSYTRVTSNEGTVAGKHYISKTGYRQKKPYNLNLPYSTWSIYCISSKKGYAAGANVPMNASSSGQGQTGCVAFSHVNGFAQNTSFTAANSFVSEVTNKARERFISTMKGSAGLGVDLAEGKQTIRTLEKRFVQLRTAVKHLKRGEITKAAKLFRVSDHAAYHKLSAAKIAEGKWVRYGKSGRYTIKASPRERKRLLTPKDKAYSDLFLEFHFGWEPIVKDVYACIDVLQRDIPAGRICGRSYGTTSLKNVETYPSVWPYKYTFLNTHTLSVSAVVGATVSVSNPNLALANQLGLINPLSLAWELVPFSFVVDWFVNVGNFLESFTDTAGYSISDPFVRIWSGDVCYHSLRDPAGLAAYGNELAYEATTRSSSTSRVLTLPGVTLKTRDSWNLSPTRAITACALLIQQAFR